MGKPTRIPQPDPAESPRDVVERELNRKTNKENPPSGSPDRGETREEKPHAPSASSRPPGLRRGAAPSASSSGSAKPFC
jgi:hypothetical protein